MELEGHLTGMLDRDQRTAKCPTIAQCSKCHATCARMCHCQAVLAPRRHFEIRLKELLLVSAYLLIVIPTALCAPTGTAMNDDKPNNKAEHWILPPIEVTFRGNVTPETRKQAARESAKFIKLQAKKALDKANANLGKYTHDRFNRTPDKMGMYNHKIEWFPNVDNLTEVDGVDVVTPDAMAEIMVDLYEHFQKFAVGMDQVRHEHSHPNDNLRLAAMFEEMGTDLTAVLHELQSGIAALGGTHREDVRRDHLPGDLRRLDETKRLFRDWAIYRDYINLLAYTHRTFDQMVGGSAAHL